MRIDDRRNYGGQAGTGKTTLPNILANSIPDEDRILIIEDTAELALRKPHVVCAEAQLDTHKSTITFDDLLSHPPASAGPDHRLLQCLWPNPPGAVRDAKENRVVAATLSQKSIDTIALQSAEVSSDKDTR